jgi:pyrimidine-specific ribonucleoside hydrolase
MFAIGLFLLLFVLSGLPHATASPVWIDADPACGLGMTDDVDDCWAIIAAIRSSSLHVVGVSTVFGNVQVDHATDNAKALLNAISLHEPGRVLPPVYQGAGRPIKQVTDIPPAVMELETALTESPVTILALGPLTNVAILMKHHPELIPRITTIVAVAGQRPGQVFRVGNTPILHFHDLNVRKDPDAVEIVLRAGVPLYLIPFEVGQQVVITRRDLHVLEQQSSLDAWLSARSAPWFEFWEHTLGAQGFSPFDLLAVAFVVDPSQFTCQTIPARLVRRHGLFVVRDTLEVSPSFEGHNTVRYCSDISSAVRRAPIKLLAPE